MNLTHVPQCKDAQMSMNGPVKEICDVLDKGDHDARLCKKNKICTVHEVRLLNSVFPGPIV